MDFFREKQFAGNGFKQKTRPSALGMSDPIWGPLIYIFVDKKKKCEG